MNTQNSIYDEKRDMDTLGGRMGRAREASGLSIEEMALQLGVTQDTWELWEADREEPRANRLAMLAGFLNVSPSWLLYGVGEAPNLGGYSEVVATLYEKLSRIEEAHEQTGEAIQSLKTTIAQLSSQEPENDDA